MAFKARVKKLSKSFYADLRKAVQDAVDELNQRKLDEIRDYALELLERTTAGWQGGADGSGKKAYPKPSFTVQVKKVGEHVASVTISTDSYLWNLLDRGTEGMVIRPKKAQTLAFKPRNYQRTTPGSLDVGRASISGETLFRKEVKGFAGRRWTETVANELNKKYGKDGITIRVVKL